MEKILRPGTEITRPNGRKILLDAVFSNTSLLHLAGYNDPTGCDTPEREVRCKRIGPLTSYAAAVKSDIPVHVYTAVVSAEFVRNAEIYENDDIPEDYYNDDPNWKLDEEAEVFLGIFQGVNEEAVMRQVLDTHSLNEDVIRLIEIC